jgi:hypothetical protein
MPSLGTLNIVDKTAIRRAFDLPNSVTTCLTPVRHDTDRPEPLQLAPAGPSAISIDTASRPHYTRTHARASLVSARERRVPCVPNTRQAGRGGAS